MSGGYLTFIPTLPEGRKTYVVEVYASKTGYLLGKIRWYGSWRQYAFFPQPDTIWNVDCLQEIKGAIARLMEDRRTKEEEAAT